MTLVDTSVWIDHFRGADRAAELVTLAADGEILVHPWVRGELALGSLGRRGPTVMSDLGLLPQAPVVADGEVLELIGARRLDGRGLGWVDVQLLASALVAGSRLWSFDRRLGAAARELGVA